MSDANSAASGSASQNNNDADAGASNNRNRTNNNFYNNQTFPAARKEDLGKFELHSPTDQARAIDQYEKTMEYILNHVASNNTDYKHVGRMLQEGFVKGEMPSLSISAQPTQPNQNDSKYEMQVAASGGKGTTTVVDQDLYKHDWEVYRIEHEEWRYQRGIDAKKIEALEDGIPKMARLILNQCSEQLISTIKQQEQWRDLEDMKSPVELGALIRKVMLGFTDALEPNLRGMLIMRLWLTFFQGPRLGLMRYDELHRGVIKLVREMNNGELLVPFDIVLEQLRLDEPSIAQQYDNCTDGTFDPRVSYPAEWKAAREKAERRFDGAVCLANLNPEKHGALQERIRQAYVEKGEYNIDSREKVIFIASNSASRSTPRARPYQGRSHVQVGHFADDICPEDIYFGNEICGANYLTEGDQGKFYEEGMQSDREWSKVKVTADSGCLHCGDKTQDGHQTKDCPFLSQEEQRQVGDILDAPAEAENEGTPAESGATIAIDSAATHCTSTTASAQYLRNVKEAARPLIIEGNIPGANTSTHSGTIGPELESYVDPASKQSVVPIEDLAAVGCRVQLDTDKSMQFKVSQNGESITSFKNEVGLPVFKYESLVGLLDNGKKEEAVKFTDEFLAERAEFKIAGKCYVQTVNANYEGFTKEEVKRAYLAREAAGMIGGPSEVKMQFLVSNNKLDECPFNLQDVRNAYKIFGPNLSTVRGKTVRRAPARVQTDYIEVPRDFLLLVKNVTLLADVMFVNKVPFLITVSRKIKFITVEFLSSRTAKQLSKKLKRILRLYGRAGLTVHTILMDMEFDKVADALEGDIVVNTAAAREHVGEVERDIRLVKERCRGVVSCLPYTCLHKQIVINVVYFAALWLNAFVRKSGCSTDFSPRAIVLHTALSYKQHCRAQFGEYCEAHEDATKTNGMNSRTFPAICLGPTGNRQGTYKMFDLETCRVHKVRSFTRMIMPESLAAQVNAIGARTQREV